MKYLLVALLTLILPFQAVAMTIPMSILNNPGAVVSNTATRYATCGSQGLGTLGSTNTPSPMPISGTLSKLYVSAPTPITTGSYTFTVQKNRVNTAITVTLDSGTTTALDNVNTVSFSPGDTCTIQIVPTGTPTALNVGLYISSVFEGDTAGESMVLSAGSNVSDLGGSGFIAFGTFLAGNGTQVDRSTYMPTSGTIDHLYATGTASVATGGKWDIYLLVNNATTSLFCTINGPARNCNNTSDSVAVDVGDRMQFYASSTGAGATASILTGVRFTPTVDGETPIFYFTTSNPSAGLNRYMNPGGALAPSATEASTTARTAVGFTWRKLYVEVNTAPGAGNSREFSGRINNATTTLSATLVDSDLVGQDVDTDVPVAFGDFWNWVTAPVSSPTSPGALHVSAVMFIDPGGAPPAAGYADWGVLWFFDD